MCGLSGYINLSAQTHLPVSLLGEMNDTMFHRGPDGDGFYIGGQHPERELDSFVSQRPQSIFMNQEKSPRALGLAHRRLSIIDLNPNAGQPMSTADGKVNIVFNGEIYNHENIRKQLENKYTFKTDHSDTETILYAYKEWGIDCIKKLRGMFAIALWDNEKDTLWLVRDRTGMKPLYYAQHNGRLLFASEIKAILADPSFPRRMNDQSLYDYLSFLTVPAPNTMFEGVFKLPAAHIMKIEKGVMNSPKPYWDVFDNATPSTSSKSDLIDGVINKLDECVESHLISDVPVGVFLSGGIDSSTNAALFSKHAPGRVKAFSIGYENDDALESYTNEFKYSRQMAELLDLEYYEQSLTQDDLIDFLPKLIHHQDEPIADPVCVPVYYVSKLARDNGVIVAQVGEGSDELFCGYDSWMEFLKLDRWNRLPVPGMFKHMGLQLLKAAGKEHAGYTEYLRRGANGMPVFWGGAEAFYQAGKHSLLSDEFLQKQNGRTSWEALRPHYETFLQTAPDTTALNWMSYIDLKLRLPELLLMRVDKMAMSVSLEGRVPFLDHEFVEMAMQIPAKMKTKDGINKFMLKKAVEPIIPHNIIYRKKQGFGAPVYDWFMDRLGDMAKKEINEFNEQTHVFKPEELEKLYERKEGMRVWFLLNLALWWKACIA